MNLKLRTFLLSVFLHFVILLMFRVLDIFNNLLFEQIILGSFLVFIVIWFWQKFIAKKSILTILLLSMSASILVEQSTILNIDRSRSFYVLAWTHKNLISFENGILDLTKVQSDEKLGLTGIETRINEQISRGLMTKRSSELKLSNFGKVYYFCAEKIAIIYRLDNWAKNNH
jgi:hypothetical protein